MTQDARFEDGADAPLRLKALDADDLSVVSSLVQDSVFPSSQMVWKSKERRFALLLNRFRWEDADTVLSLLSISFEAGEDGTGTVILTLAGDGAIALSVEALEVVLRDVTRPYVAPSHKAPQHPE